MKRTITFVLALLLSSVMMASNFVLISYQGKSQAEKLFSDKNLTIHYYNDNQVFATAEKFDASYMVLLDEAAFSNNDIYTLVYCPATEQAEYSIREGKQALWKSEDCVLFRGPVSPYKNDGAIAITNGLAKLPTATRQFPVVEQQNADIAYLMEQVSQDEMHATVAYLQAYQNRKWNTDNAKDASDWIKSRFEELGLEVEQQPFVYSGQQAAPNVIAIQRGTVNPDTYVVCGSHFDSYSYSGTCPGADDNATGVASVLETARLLSQYQFDNSIIYCAFGCEEMGLVGSEAYASRCQQQNMDIIGYFNNDMNGYLYGNEVHIHQIYPSSAEDCGAFYRTVGAVYFPDMVIEHKNFSSGDSDHTSFNNHGYQGIYPFEDVNNYSPYIHSPADTIGLSVNGWLMPQRYCQMNLGCVAECAGIHPMGAIVNQDVVIAGDDNFNLRMNPGETISLTVTMGNVFEEAVEDVTVMLNCNNEFVTILNGTADFGDFAAMQTKTVENAFSFSLASNAISPAKYNFSLEAHYQDEVVTSYFNLISYSPSLTFGGIAVLDDNAILEPGETATMRIMIDNLGNEMAFDLNGVLSCNSEYVTLHNTEVHFCDALLPESMAFGDFEVSLSANAPADFVLPFALTIEDEVFEFEYKNACNVIFELTDSWGDGWNGASLTVSFSDGTPSQDLTVSYGSHSDTFVIEITSGVEVSLTWHSGSYDNECGYTISYENGTVIYTGSGTQSGTFFTWVNNCSGGSGASQEFCAGVTDLAFDGEQNLLTWTAPDGAQPIEYEVYANTIYLGFTQATELTVLPELMPVADLTIDFCVNPVYEQCYGDVECVEAHWDPTDVEEYHSTTQLFPNPAHHQVTVEASAIHQITLYNAMGQLVASFAVNGEAQHTLNLSAYPAGLYLLYLVTEEGTETLPLVIE